MENAWPKLEYKEWKPTYETLHRWLQIVGKVRMCKSPFANHSWNTTFYVTSRGLTTSAIPNHDSCLTIDFDFIDHTLLIQDSLGKKQTMKLQQKSVAEFYDEFMNILNDFNVEPTFVPAPNELMDATPFHEDRDHRTYNPEHAHQCFQVLVRVNNVLQFFRSQFVGKSSPVHFFWGSFDLAVTRFSGRRAPEHPGGVPHLPDIVAREAYSHEVMSCGFWPGNEMYKEAAFYAYAYPEPDRFSKARITPPEAFYHQDLHEFVLPYEAVRTSVNPFDTLMSFFNSTYKVAANLASWDRDILEVSPQLLHMQELNHQRVIQSTSRQDDAHSSIRQ